MGAKQTLRFDVPRRCPPQIGRYPSRRFYVSSCATLVRCVFKQRHRNLGAKNYALPILNSKRFAQKEPTKPSKGPFCRFILVQSGDQIAGLWVDVIPDSSPTASFLGTHSKPMRVHQRTEAPFYLRLIFQLRPPLRAPSIDKLVLSAKSRGTLILAAISLSHGCSSEGSISLSNLGTGKNSVDNGAGAGHSISPRSRLPTAYCPSMLCR
jgi:hypothetical protein